MSFATTNNKQFNDNPHDTSHPSWRAKIWLLCLWGNISFTHVCIRVISYEFYCEATHEPRLTSIPVWRATVIFMFISKPIRHPVADHGNGSVAHSLPLAETEVSRSMKRPAQHCLLQRHNKTTALKLPVAPSK